MKILYQTIDGKTFVNELEAKNHEASLLRDTVYMYTRDGRRTQYTDEAEVLLLYGTKAADYFLTYADDCGDLFADDCRIESGDEGVFYWDAEGMCYVEIPVEFEEGVYTALAQLKSLDADEGEETPNE
jgi:hypothetical protein